MQEYSSRITSASFFAVLLEAWAALSLHAAALTEQEN
jgi:hypothetical protein